MGVKDLFKIVDKNGNTIESHGKIVKLSDMKNKSIVVDGNLFSCKSFLAISEANALRDSEGRITNHLKLLLTKVIQFNKLGIRQLWVFDNPAQNPRKLQTSMIRKQKDGLRLTSDNYNEIKELLRYLGIAYVVAPVGIEAEQYASWLTQCDSDDEFAEPLYDYVLSSDSDVIMFGGNMLRQYSTRPLVNGKRTTKQHLATFNYKQLMKDLDLEQNDLFKMATMMGHDFYPQGVARVGPKSTFKKIHNFEMNTEQADALEQFILNPNDYLELAEFTQEPFAPDSVLQMLLERNFKESILRKQLEEFNISIL